MTSTASGKKRLSGLLSLFFPLLLMTFSNCLFLMLEKLFLARISQEALQAAVASTYVCQVFQMATIALAMMAQIFVAQWVGANKQHLIGPGIWQFIWFSLLSTCITIPATLLYGKFYFQGSPIEALARPYFHLLTGMSFLYPLGAALLCFYLGQQKTRLVVLATLCLQGLKVVLGYLFIFGIGPFPALGILGGALSTLLSQIGFCLILFTVFLNSRYRTLCATHVWRFQFKLFCECIYPGCLRAINRILNFTCWVSITYLMSIRGGDYALVLSIGGTLFLFLPFLCEALSNAQMTIIAQLIGAGRILTLKASEYSGYFLGLGISLIVAIPLLIFPIKTFHFLFPSLLMSDQLIYPLFVGVFFSFAFFVLSSIPISTVLAFKDMKFSLFMGGVNWINGFLLMFLAIVKIGIRPEQFWLVLSLMHGSTALCYFFRSRWLYRKAINLESQIAISN